MASSFEELVYVTMLKLPGEFFSISIPKASAPELLQSVRRNVCVLKPAPAYLHYCSYLSARISFVHLAFFCALIELESHWKHPKQKCGLKRLNTSGTDPHRCLLRGSTNKIEGNGQLSAAR
ncbi:hypothetical protein NPIL_43801 [Nephila pilipes]|uniref:Uncharacterized protein n=1 Tax=Nephila pilipes TaxID=299642 RepID=A0A8X6TPY9_NEPPI|nr:hypothetical protein NPIL_43801 [Nephila pilipes]